MIWLTLFDVRQDVELKLGDNLADLPPYIASKEMFWKQNF